MDNEYISIRDEIMKWQDRRIAFSQISLTIVTAYVGYMIGKDITAGNFLSWQITSALPLLILSMTMHITRLFELFHLRAAAFLAVYHNSLWENTVSRVSFSKGIWRVGYNKSMAIVYLLVAVLSVIIFIDKFPRVNSFFHDFIFGVCAFTFLYIFISLFTFDTGKEKDKLLKKWNALKQESPVNA